MRTITILALFLILNNVVGPAQTKRDQIQAQKVAFFTQKLDLTPAEAEKFWPIYNEYQEKRNTIILSKRKLSRKVVNGANTMSDQEISNALTQHINLQKEETAILDEYNEKIKKNTSPAKSDYDLYCRGSV